MVRRMRTLRARAAVLKLLTARKAYEQERYRGTERRQQLRDDSRLELFFRMGAALTILLGAGTGLHFEDTRHRLALCRRAFLERKLAGPAREPLDNS